MLLVQFRKGIAVFQVWGQLEGICGLTIFAGDPDTIKFNID